MNVVIWNFFEHLGCDSSLYLNRLRLVEWLGKVAEKTYTYSEEIAQKRKLRTEFTMSCKTNVNYFGAQFFLKKKFNLKLFSKENYIPQPLHGSNVPCGPLLIPIFMEI